MSKQLCMTVNKIFNWSPTVDNNSIFTLQFYSNQTHELIVQKKVQGVYSLNNMFLNSALKINYTDEEGQVLLKIQFGNEQICSFCIDLICLKEKRVQYFPFPGKDKVLQINLTDFDPYQNKLKEKNIQDFPVQNLDNHQTFLRQRELFLHNSYANQRNMRRNFSQNINRLLGNMNTPKNSQTPYYRAQREERQQERNCVRTPNYRQYSGYKQNSARGFPIQRDAYRNNYYNHHLKQSNHNEYDDYDTERIKIRNHNHMQRQRQIEWEMQRELEFQKRLPRASSERMYQYRYQKGSQAGNFMRDVQNRQTDRRQRQILGRNYFHQKTQRGRDREDSKEARSSTSSNHKLILNTLNVVPKQEYYVQKGDQLREMQKNAKEIKLQPNSEYFNQNKQKQVNLQNKPRGVQQNQEKIGRQLEVQQTIVQKQQRSGILDKDKQKQENLQKLFSQMSKHYQFQQKLKKNQHRNQIRR